ncbi:MAG: tyrosine-protein phosphatase, partial [Anaerolineae bacterium]|nr:tyrosine-protein phosphatase [Anaerolineae bacterium]
VLFHDHPHRTRPYFQVTLDDEPPFVVAERALPLEGVANARDIGGYRTADGQRVRWGQVYRSGALGGATDADLEMLQALGIRLVCDLRSVDEVADDADRLPHNPAPVYRHLPIEGGGRTRDQIRTLLLNPHNLQALMDKTYTEHIIGQSGPIFGSMLRDMADPANLPILIHCTAGKDRTGVIVALLLAALGVPDEVIIADYSLSNRFFTTFRDFIAGKFKQPQAFLFGIHIDDFQPLITAPPQTMQHTLDYIRQRYGSVEAYLEQAAGVDADTLAALKANLLV